MTSARRGPSVLVLVFGLVLGTTAGYLLARASDPKTPSETKDVSAELQAIRAELDQLKAQHAPTGIGDEVRQLETIVTDILLRGDEFSLRADFARTADRLDGRSASDFALRDADGDGSDDLSQIRKTVDEILSGAKPVAKAKKADTAGNAEFLGNLPLTDFALAEHRHSTLAGDVNLLDGLRVGGALAVTGNTIASGDVQVFGEVVAIGGLMPGTVNIDPKPGIAGMIRYNRGTGALEYCDGMRWNEVAVVQQQ